MVPVSLLKFPAALPYTALSGITWNMNHSAPILQMKPARGPRQLSQFLMAKSDIFSAAD